MKRFLILAILLICVGCLADKVETVRYVNHLGQDVVLRDSKSREVFAEIKSGSYYESASFGNTNILDIVDVKGRRLGRVVSGDYKRSNSADFDWMVDLK